MIICAASRLKYRPSPPRTSNPFL
uniref:Uncharacterized protein MANES_06G141300 n=1 Tax=Rhizophora mucronata TaxID=61149 RepID=A0A2P2LS04_RHIMU